jgi:hypothetical protein
MSTAAVLDSWAILVAGFVFAVVAVARVTGRFGGTDSGTVARNLRATFLVGLTLCVTFTVLFVVGGFSDGVFHDEDIVLLAVCWSALTLLWLASRYIPAFMRRRAGDA